MAKKNVSVAQERIGRKLVKRGGILGIAAGAFYGIYLMGGQGGFEWFSNYMPNINQNTTQQSTDVNQNATATVIYMQFKENHLELHGQLYYTIEELEKAIPTLQKEFFNKKVHIEYIKQDTDPYIFAKQAQDLLTNNNFSVIQKKSE